MPFYEFEAQQEALSFLEQSAEVRRWRQFETALCAELVGHESVRMRGFCLACERPRQFEVDRQFGAIDHGDGRWEPNWRERMVCPGCGLNSRQRAIAVAARQIAEAGSDRRRAIYVTERIGPLYVWLSSNLAVADLTGSEFLSEKEGASGLVAELRDCVQHQDLEHLDFESRSFDGIVCNDVLEHVNEPLRCLEEMARVLRPGGKALITVPLAIGLDRSVRRARSTDGDVVFLQSPRFHGDPLSEAGALVYHDFGWDLVHSFRECGFASASLVVYWSYLFGYVGVPQFYLRAEVAPEA
jgi:SAM-dependent methyltransferase